MMSPPDEIVAQLKALASPNRLSILMLFDDATPKSVGSISAACGLAQSTTSEQLAILKRAGLVTSERNGKEVLFLPDRAKIISFLDTISTYLKTCC